MIDIQQTDTEYLLFIPAAQKERARGIEGRRWDPERKCWVYPRSGRVYEALIAEFGDDLVSVSISRPTRPEQNLSQATTVQLNQDLRAENQSLKHNLDRIVESLELIKQTNGNQTATEIQDLKTALASRERELADMQRQFERQGKELEESRQIIVRTKAEVDQLQAMNKALKIDADKRKPEVNNSKTYFKRLKNLAIEAAGKNSKFTELVTKLELSDSLPVTLGKELERELRRRLNLNTDDKTMKLHDLIVQADDAMILTREGIDLAHFIRKQRNIMAHDGVEQHTCTARMLMSLYAASLLWPELSE